MCGTTAPWHGQYDTLNNGDKAFRVALRGDTVDVAVLLYDDDDDAAPVPKPCFSVSPKRVFVGRSPRNAMTRFSDGYGPRFDGNSLLLELDGLRYLHIGSDVLGFRTDSPIQTYVSPVGNSGVPYPYAVDARGSVHLVIEDVTMALPTPLKHGDDPYRIFDRKSLIAPFEGISEFIVGGKACTLTYQPNAAKSYDRIVGRHRTTDVHVVQNGERVALTKAAYVALMRRFGKSIGCRRLRTTTFVEGDDGRGAGASAARILRWSQKQP